MKNESGAVSAGGGREAAPIPEVLPITHNLIQIDLALMYYKRSHDAAHVDLLHPMQTPKEIRDAAMLAWIQNGFATAFSQFRDAHQNLQIHVGNEAELADLLSATQETMH